MKLPISAVLVAMMIMSPVVVIAREAAPQRRCDPAAIAKVHVAKHFSSFASSGLHSREAEQVDSWEVTYDLPDGMLGRFAVHRHR